MLKENQYREDVLEYIKRNTKILKSSEERAIFERLSKGTDIEKLFLTEKLAKIILAHSDGKERKNVYVAVREAYLDYQLGVLSLQQLLDKLRSVYHRQYVVHEEFKKVLKSDRSVSEGGLRGIRPDLLAEELLTAILVMQAKAVLYDAGFPYEHRKEREEDREHESSAPADYKDSGRRRDSALELADLYMERKGYSLYKEEAGVRKEQERNFDDDFKLRCMKAYQVLQNEKRDTVCLPLYVENKTGSGIYIVGRKLLDAIELKRAERDFALKEKTKGSQLYCHFCYLYNLEINNEEDGGFSVTMSTEYICGNDIDCAIRAFQDARLDRYGTFQDHNGVFPEELDEKYKVFFREAEPCLKQEYRKEEVKREQYKAEREKDPIYQKMLKKRKM